jgi:acyl carrier protein phosphodiesterase
MRSKVVPEDTQVDSVHQIFGDVVDDTTDDVVALPTRERINEDVRSEKLLVHYKMEHLLFAAINQMASRGKLPRRLAKVGDPMYASCMYGQLTRKAW